MYFLQQQLLINSTGHDPVCKLSFNLVRFNAGT